MRESRFSLTAQRDDAQRAPRITQQSGRRKREKRGEEGGEEAGEGKEITSITALIFRWQLSTEKGQTGGEKEEEGAGRGGEKREGGAAVGSELRTACSHLLY